jgi:hypothetical protein
VAGNARSTRLGRGAPQRHGARHAPAADKTASEFSRRPGHDLSESCSAWPGPRCWVLKEDGGAVTVWPLIRGNETGEPWRRQRRRRRRGWRTADGSLQPGQGRRERLRRRLDRCRRLLLRRCGGRRRRLRGGPAGRRAVRRGSRRWWRLLIVWRWLLLRRRLLRRRRLGLLQILLLLLLLLVQRWRLRRRRRRFLKRLRLMMLRRRLLKRLQLMLLQQLRLRLLLLRRRVKILLLDGLPLRWWKRRRRRMLPSRSGNRAPHLRNMVGLS